MQRILPFVIGAVVGDGNMAGHAFEEFLVHRLADHRQLTGMREQARAVGQDFFDERDVLEIFQARIAHLRRSYMLRHRATILLALHPHL